MFEEATRYKYRFPSSLGMLNVEDLWDLKVEHLDVIYKSLKSALKKVEEESLLTKVSDADKELQDKLGIVTHIFNVKVGESEARKQLKEKSERKQYLLSILQKKQNAEYEGMSVDEIQKLISEL